MEKNIDLVTKLEKIALICQEDEFQLVDKKITNRKSSGSFYTPFDVANFICNKVLDDISYKNPSKLKKIIKDFFLLEPSCGSGIFIFTFLKCLAERGIEEKDLRKFKVVAVDINNNALDYIKHKLKEEKVNVDIRTYNSDFRDLSISKTKKIPIIIGNPPFVKGDEKSIHKNVFADFLDASISKFKNNGSLCLILPLSICFSRDYVLLREKLKSLDSEIKFFNFDNIPDSLFFAGKPGSLNTNRANSQRCSIVLIKPSQRNRIFSSKLISWKRDERKTMLKSKITLFEITDIYYGNQFIRPFNRQALEMIKKANGTKAKHFLSQEGKHILYIASVARNFISFRKKNYSQSISLPFKNKNDLLLIFAVLNSKEFFFFWKSVGDGFHLSKDTISNFVISERMHASISNDIKEIGEIYANKEQFKKTRIIRNKKYVSYDFSSHFWLS